jgi:hypothetical protein
MAFCRLYSNPVLQSSNFYIEKSKWIICYDCMFIGGSLVGLHVGRDVGDRSSSMALTDSLTNYLATTVGTCSFTDKSSSSADESVGNDISPSGNASQCKAKPETSESDAVQLGKLLRSNEFRGALENGAMVYECQGNSDDVLAHADTNGEGEGGDDDKQGPASGVQVELSSWPAYGWGQNLTEINVFFKVS